ncbi:MAG: hypothetical protein AB7G28_15855 [Pirellulales bacterium]
MSADRRTTRRHGSARSCPQDKETAYLSLATTVVRHLPPANTSASPESVSDGQIWNSTGPVPEGPITSASNDRRLAAA